MSKKSLPVDDRVAENYGARQIGWLYSPTARDANLNSKRRDFEEPPKRGPDSLERLGGNSGKPLDASVPYVRSGPLGQRHVGGIFEPPKSIFFTDKVSIADFLNESRHARRSVKLTPPHRPKRLPTRSGKSQTIPAFSRPSSIRKLSAKSGENSQDCLRTRMPEASSHATEISEHISEDGTTSITESQGYISTQDNVPCTLKPINLGSFIAGEASLMLNKVAKTGLGAASSCVFSEIPPAMISHRAFVDAEMPQCKTAKERYTQILIWCLSRRATALSKPEVTTKGMRLVQTLAAIRASLRDDGFAGTTNSLGREHPASLDLKPTQPNPKNLQNSKDANEFLKFLNELLKSKTEAFHLLGAAERKPQAESCVAVDSVPLRSELSLEFKFQDVLARTRRLVCHMAVRSIELERVNEDACCLVEELQTQYIERLGEKSADTLLNALR